MKGKLYPVFDFLREISLWKVEVCPAEQYCIVDDLSHSGEH